jgi:large subunit ribosomal protein L4
MKGAQVGTLSIDEQALGGTINAPLIKQAYVMYHANRRQGSSKTLNRHEVEGSTKKLYKQKGTGNARHGDRKVNLMKGGGHGHSKKRVREDFRLDMPVKMRRKANRNAFLAKLLDNEVKIVDAISLQQVKTKEFTDFLRAIGVDKTALVALGVLTGENGANDAVRRAARNVDEVSLCSATGLNAFDMLNHRFLVIARGELEAWLQGPTSQTDKSAKVAPKGRGSSGRKDTTTGEAA